MEILMRSALPCEPGGRDGDGRDGDGVEVKPEGVGSVDTTLGFMGTADDVGGSPPCLLAQLDVTAAASKSMATQRPRFMRTFIRRLANPADVNVRGWPTTELAALVGYFVK
jgi:hypothetical protein